MKVNTYDEFINFRKIFYYSEEIKDFGEDENHEICELVL